MEVGRHLRDREGSMWEGRRETRERERSGGMSERDREA